MKEQEVEDEEMDMASFIAGMPKAELHLHVDGLMGPEMLLELAERNNIDFPYKTVEEIIAAQDYGEPALENFLEYHFNTLKVIQTAQDVYEIMVTFMEKCQEENIRHIEIMFDPQTHLPKGISFKEYICALHQGRLAGSKKFGVSTNLIMCARRDLGPESAMELLELARPFKEFIKGVGLDSKEAGNPPIKFMEFFMQAKKEGYHLTAHCDCDQKDSIRNIGQCIDLLGVERIDHGVNVVEDRDLMKSALEKNIGFTMCPTWRTSDPEPRRLKRLKQMFDLGLMVTINTDNPCEFDSGYLIRTLLGVQQHSGYTALEMVEYMRRAFLSSWLDEEDKKMYIKELNDYAIDCGVTEIPLPVR